MSTPEFRFINPKDVSRVKPGTIMFLPPHELMPKGTYTDPSLLAGAFNHPVVIVSCPSPTEIKPTSHVEIAIMTSFGATSLKAHLSLKGLKFHTPTLAAQYSGHLRVVTANKPFAKDALKLRNGKGMKRDFSYVKIMETFRVEVRGLACYGFRREEVDTYCLTSHATRKVVEGIRERREWMRGRVERRRVKDEGEREKVEKDRAEKERAEKAKTKKEKAERANVKKVTLEAGRVEKQKNIKKRVASQKIGKAVEKGKKMEKQTQKQNKTEKRVERQKKAEKKGETQKKKVKMITKNTKTKTNKARREGSHCPYNGGDRKSMNVLGST